MPIKHPFNIYREQLWPLYHGSALWKPNPIEGIYNQVSIGDVGYIREGGFIRMFNVTLPWDDDSNKTLGEPCRYDPLSSDNFAIHRETFGKVDYYSRRVSREETVGNTLAASPDEAECVTYICRGRGALLSLPNGGLRQDVIHTKVFQKYIKDNVASWFNWSKKKGLPVKSMEDLVFVYGCTLVSSWAAAAFDDHTGNAQLSLVSRTLNNGGAGFTWSNIHGTVEYHDSQLNPNIPYLPQNRCVFIKCLRARRILFIINIPMKGLPIQVIRDREKDGALLDAHSHDEVSLGAFSPSYDEASPEYLDPLIGVLNYIKHKKNYPEDDNVTAPSAVAVAHDNDLQFVERVDSLTGDVVENFLHENKIPVVLEDGLMTLHYPHRQDNEHGKSDEVKFLSRTIGTAI